MGFIYLSCPIVEMEPIYIWLWVMSLGATWWLIYWYHWHQVTQLNWDGMPIYRVKCCASIASYSHHVQWSIDNALLCVKYVVTIALLLCLKYNHVPLSSCLICYGLTIVQSFSLTMHVHCLGQWSQSSRRLCTSNLIRKHNLTIDC